MCYNTVIMPRKSRRPQEDDWEESGLSRATKRGLLIFALCGVILLFIASALGFAGVVGEYVDKILSVAFGWSRLFLPIVLLGIVYYLIKAELFDVPPSKYIGMLMLFLGFTACFHSFMPMANMQVAASEGLGGGYLGFAMALLLQRFLGYAIALFVVFAMIVAGFLVFFNVPFHILVVGSEENPSVLRKMWMRWQEEKRAVMRADEEAEEEEELDELDAEEVEEAEEEEVVSEVATPAKPKMVEGKNDESEDDEEEPEMPVRPARRRQVKIPLDLLDERRTNPNSGDVNQNKEIIRATFENFSIPVEMDEVNVGPTVAQYTMKPAQGIKLTKIVALNNDLALALAAHPIRIEAPIPGRSLIGVEVPNKTGAVVGLKDLLMSREYRKLRKEATLVLPLGLDVAGKSYAIALEKMPHLLVAGATGSGKSVAVNAMILSLLYQHGPDALRFIMVDPKRVELQVYNRVPHLLTPVITDAKKTINALKWLVTEMDRRYETLAGKGKRNISSYNEVAEEPLPYIVLIIDELADLMIVAAAEVETYIIRLAQMARAVGIHLILATQRPSVDVITGLLKANIPGRIAFSVASAVDSRTILDEYGAEKLVGRGDMLFSSAEVSKPRRVQGPYVSEHEVKRIVSFLADEIGEPAFIEEVTEKQQTPTAFQSGDDDGDGDDLFNEAKEIVVKAQKASTSYLQRKLRIGYARAARLMDLLEDAGVVGSADGSRAREVLIRPGEDGKIATETGENPDFVDEAQAEEGEEEESDADDEDVTDAERS